MNEQKKIDAHRNIERKEIFPFLASKFIARVKNDVLISLD